jgi:HKD family nuclease
MDIKYLNQPKDIKMGELLNKNLTKGKFDSVWIVSGIVKDSGFDLIWDSLQKAAEKGIKINIVIGIDKKNTSRDLLTKLLKLNCNVRYYNNNGEDKFETRAYIFEKTGGTSLVYHFGGKLSEGGLLENNCLVTEMKYTARDSSKYDQFKSSLVMGFDNELFIELSEIKIQELSDSGDIFARITDRKIPSINDIFNKNGVSAQEYDESLSSGYSGETYDDIEFDVELPEILEKDLGVKVPEKQTKDKKEKKTKETAVKTVNKEAISLDNLWKEQNEAISGTKNTKKISVIKDPDFKNMTTLIMQINKVTSKGVGSNEIKVPNSLFENITGFFGYPNEFELIEVGKGKVQNALIVKFDIVDNKETAKSLTDNAAEFYKTERYLAISSDVLNGLMPEENDILRLIKLDKKKYKAELIRQDTPEYIIWERYCVNAIRGQSRKFGII